MSLGFVLNFRMYSGVVEVEFKAVDGLAVGSACGWVLDVVSPVGSGEGSDLGSDVGSGSDFGSEVVSGSETGSGVASRSWLFGSGSEVGSATGSTNRLSDQPPLVE